MNLYSELLLICPPASNKVIKFIWIKNLLQGA